MMTLMKIFPPLAELKAPGEEQVKLVNGGIVEEVLLPLGQLDFGKGLVAKCDVSLWRTRGEHKSLVGEFAFQAKFGNRGEIRAKAEEAGGTVLRVVAARRAGLAAVGLHQDGNGLSPERQRTDEPRIKNNCRIGGKFGGYEHGGASPRFH